MQKLFVNNIVDAETQQQQLPAREEKEEILPELSWNGCMIVVIASNQLIFQMSVMWTSEQHIFAA